MSKAHFTVPVLIPSDPDSTDNSAATIGDVEEIVAVAIEPTVDLVVLFENALL